MKEHFTDTALAVVLRSSFGVQTATLLIDDEAWGCTRERYGNGAYLLSVNLAAHQCELAGEASVTLELWAYTDTEFEWFIDWRIQAPFNGQWPFGVEFCPFCGVDLRTFHQLSVCDVLP